MKRQEYKTITAIATNVNGALTYISGQSIREDNKYLPQFNTDPVHAKEFESDEIYLTDEEQALHYLTNVHNPYHRVYNVVQIEIPNIKDLKKYDRDKHKVQTRTVAGAPSSRKKVLTDVLLIFIACIVLVSCSKSQITPNAYVFDKYQMIIEHYTMDTVLTGKFIWWHSDSIWKAETKRLLDTITPKWYLMCETEKMPLHLEYWYYTRNGIKIDPIKK